MDKITVTIPLELAVKLSEMKDTYAPLLREIGNICFDKLYEEKVIVDADIPSI